MDLNLTFPENYGSTELAGQDVVFHVTINSVKRVPEMTDEVVQAISDYDTVDDYRSNITKELEEQKVASQRSRRSTICIPSFTAEPPSTATRRMW